MGGELVLVVDDEVVLVRLTVRVLERNGYRTATASSGADAIHLLRGGLRPDLIVLDYSMPGGMSGAAFLATYPMLIQPPAPVIILTGDTLAAERMPPVAHHVATLIKGCSATDLLAAVRKAIDGGR